jgi:hypothetical protein
LEARAQHGRLAGAGRAVGDPNARRIMIEDAFAVTVKKNGIVLPGAFFPALNDFKPRFPPHLNF